MRRGLGILIVAGCLIGLPVQAHHAISEIYDEERTVVLEGEVVSFLFGEPHSMVQVRVPDDQGEIRTWAIEWRGARRLETQGWTADGLSAGDHVRLCGNPGRDPGAYRLYLLQLARVSTDSDPDPGNARTLCAASSASTRPTDASRPR